jgi:hypothetical protein
MTFDAFRLFSSVMQFYWVLKHGTFLAQRWEAKGECLGNHFLTTWVKTWVQKIKNRPYNAVEAV